MDQSGVWVEAEDGWIDDCMGKPVVRYAGCGSHAAAWLDPETKRIALASPELLALAELCRDVIDDDLENRPPRHSLGNMHARLCAVIAKAKE